MKRVLFCNIAYMQYYDAMSFKETPKHGGGYVVETGDAYEKYNFHFCEDGKVRGFVETKYVDGTVGMQRPKQLRIENIDSNFKNADCIDGITVVFCAHSDIYNRTVIIGWYRDATVYRARPMYHGRQYNLECAAGNARLLTESERSFFVPRAKQSGIGFGQANVWYAKDDTAADYVNSVIQYIETTMGADAIASERIPQEIPDDYSESGIGKKILVNKYERSPIARRRCLEIYGSCCLVCGFNAAEIYGQDFAGKIEVHHIVPINEVKQDYRVDPMRDLIPVCSNCHTMLHTKMKNGNYPTIELLRKRIAQNKR